MKLLQSFLKKYGIHALLVIVFFTLHNYRIYSGLVSQQVAFAVFAKLVIIAALFALLTFFFTRSVNRSLLLTTFLSLPLLFFGNFRDFLTDDLNADIVGRYSILLPLVFLILLFGSWKILRKKDFANVNYFLNLLLVVFIIIDLVSILVNGTEKLTRKNTLTKNDEVNLEKLPPPVSRPDVYYLVFDSYPGTGYLNQYMRFDNSAFNDSLTKKGFRVLADPKSNYNRTAFSISSTLNLDYLEGIRSFQPISSKDYNNAQLTIHGSLVPGIFQKYNYRFYNLSVFDFENSRSIRKETFLVLPEQDILLYNTLFHRLKKDVFWNLLTGKHAVPWVQKMFARNHTKFLAGEISKRNYNNTIVDSLSKLDGFRDDQPKFIYAHVYLPHPPFFYDENGVERNINDVVTDKAIGDSALFLPYLKYTNKVINRIVSSILARGKSNTVIIIQSDHGFRDFDGGPSHPASYFKNYSAFYFPDQNYAALYDSMSNVNTFRIVFNKYFQLEMPMKKDTVVFLKY
jgi:hypothetical protein